MAVVDLDATICLSCFVHRSSCENINCMHIYTCAQMVHISVVKSYKSLKSNRMYSTTGAARLLTNVRLGLNDQCRGDKTTTSSRLNGNAPAQWPPVLWMPSVKKRFAQWLSWPLTRQSINPFVTGSPLSKRHFLFSFISGFCSCFQFWAQYQVY